jgi:hypothetical protein
MFYQNQEQSRGELNEGIILLHDNAHPHVQDQLNIVQWQVLRHPAHSLDVSPCDFHIFGSLKKPSQAIQTCWMVIRMRLYYSGLGGRPRNYLQTGYAKLCIKPSPISMPVVIYPDCCNTFTSEHPKMGCSCTCVICIQCVIVSIHSLGTTDSLSFTIIRQNIPSLLLSCVKECI